MIFLLECSYRSAGAPSASAACTSPAFNGFDISSLSSVLQPLLSRTLQERHQLQLHVPSLMHKGLDLLFLNGSPFLLFTALKTEITLFTRRTASSPAFGRRRSLSVHTQSESKSRRDGSKRRMTGSTKVLSNHSALPFTPRH